MFLYTQVSFYSEHFIVIHLSTNFPIPEVLKQELNEKAVTSALVRHLKKSADQLVVHPSIKAEIRMTLIRVHHNTFFNLSDYLTQSIKSVCLWGNKNTSHC